MTQPRSRDGQTPDTAVLAAGGPIGTGLLDAVGNTPLIALNRLCPNPRVRLLVKLEGNNPGGSVKDRTALYMIRAAEAAGELTPGKIILEPTSGNTGIALAMIGAAKGYRVKLMLPGCVSRERSDVLAAYGAEVELTPAGEGTDGAIHRAQATYEAHPEQYFMPNQFANPNNTRAHYETTGPEIYAQTDGDIDMFVAGIGTTGTLMGVSRYLKERAPKTRVIGVEPVPCHAIQGLKNLTESMRPAIFDPGQLDETIVMSDEEAFEMTRRLALEEGIFAGVSSGAAVAGALRMAGHVDHGTIVTLICDRGDRYLSTMLFRSVCAKCPP
ncbi:MAG: PLP-dependent cysteine synthase family protein [Candidatus Hydrogenedentota bacterium]